MCFEKFICNTKMDLSTASVIAITVIATLSLCLLIVVIVFCKVYSLMGFVRVLKLTICNRIVTPRLSIHIIFAILQHTIAHDSVPGFQNDVTLIYGIIWVVEYFLWCINYYRKIGIFVHCIQIAHCMILSGISSMIAALATEPIALSTWCIAIILSFVQAVFAVRLAFKYSRIEEAIDNVNSSGIGMVVTSI